MKPDILEALIIIIFHLKQSFRLSTINSCAQGCQKFEGYLVRGTIVPKFIIRGSNYPRRYGTGAGVPNFLGCQIYCDNVNHDGLCSILGSG